MCACGQPLHYATKGLRRAVERLIAQVGPFVIVRRDQRAWRVPRHYIALHGLKAAELEALGFEEVASQPSQGA